MAVHPDDPPWGIFGLPRIITGAESYRRMLRIQDSTANGITLCTGSLGANPENDLPAIAAEFCRYIPFVHLRNIRITGARCFEETAHPSGAVRWIFTRSSVLLYETALTGTFAPITAE